MWAVGLAGWADSGLEYWNGGPASLEAGRSARGLDRATDIVLVEPGKTARQVHSLDRHAS